MIPNEISARVEEWLSHAYDEGTRERVRELIAHDEEELLDAFSQDLTFGTGGMRGVMGVGPNRLNTYTVRRATQGLADYLLARYTDVVQVKVAIAYDCRNQSAEFAATAADTLAANGILVYLYDSLRPTPQLSFTVRALSCQAGIVITASHNPKEFNGYKVYGDDGGQVKSPWDSRIMERVLAVTSQDQVKVGGARELIVPVGCEMDEAYVNAVVSYSQNAQAVLARREMPIVYTSIHGSGIESVPRALRRAGFRAVHVVEAQRKPDGNFPTVVSPNPEDPAAMDLALGLAREKEAAVVLGTDPDADRVGVYVRTKGGEYFRPDGNEIAVLLTQYVLGSLQGKSRGRASEFIVRTIVTTPMLDAIAAANGVLCKLVPTGFKYIADMIDSPSESGAEFAARFIMGAEESHGYLVGDRVRDKDAVQASVLIAEMVAYYAEEGKDLQEVLHEAYRQYGLWVQGQQSVTLKGIAGREEIGQRMARLREDAPMELLGERVVRVYDYARGVEYRAEEGAWAPFDFAKTNVIQLLTESGALITARPSGTEPKIKYYYSLRGEYSTPDSVAELRSRGEEMLGAVAAL